MDFLALLRQSRRATVPQRRRTLRPLPRLRPLRYLLPRPCRYPLPQRHLLKHTLRLHPRQCTHRRHTAPRRGRLRRRRLPLRHCHRTTMRRTSSLRCRRLFRPRRRPSLLLLPPSPQRLSMLLLLLLLPLPLLLPRRTARLRPCLTDRAETRSSGAPMLLRPPRLPLLPPRRRDRPLPPHSRRSSLRATRLLLLHRAATRA